MAKPPLLTAAEMRRRIDARRDSGREHTRKYRAHLADAGMATVKVTVPKLGGEVVRAVASAMRSGSPVELVEAARALTDWVPPNAEGSGR